MATNTPSQVILPENIQEQFNLARTKIALMKEDEIALAHLKAEIEKEVARLSITKDTLEAEVPSLESKVVKAQTDLDSITKAKEEAQTALNEIAQEYKKVSRELEKSKLETLSEATRRSEIINGVRDEQSILAGQKDAHKADLEAFAERKARVIELLTSL